jgi:uncharacterized protein with PQ loop repeat
MIEAIGYVGSAGAACMWMPQAYRAIRLRHDPAALAALSTTAYATAIVFNALLLTYGVLSSAVPVALAGAINLGCATVILSVLVSVRRGAAA